MAIAVPQPGEEISAELFGAPVANQVNTNTGAIAALQAVTTQSAWVSPALSNGWLNYGSGYQSAQYCKIGSVVWVRGVVKSGATGTIFVLPLDMRPAAHIQFACEGASAHAAFEVSSNGVLKHLIGSNLAFNIQCSFLVP